MRVIGLMSGTSFDGIEAAAAEFSQRDDVLDMTLLGELSRPMPQSLSERIAAVLPPAGTTLQEVCRLDVALGQEFAEAAAQAVAELCGGRADLVCSPGQTVFHWVEEGRARGSLQLGRSTWIAERTGLPVVFDLYNRDIAAGGQGAPLGAMKDGLVLARFEGPRATLNIGGIANVTVVTGDERLVCYDLGPGNALLDAAMTRITGGRERFDRDGRTAAAGRVDEALLAALLADPFFAQPPPKSTGKELFNLDYLDRALAGLGPIGDEDVVATLTQFTASAIGAESRRWKLRHVVASGGGVLNPVLFDRVRAECAPARVVTSEAVGFPVTAVEAYSVAFLGYLTAHGVEASIPAVTGAARASLTGSITPGLTLPDFGRRAAAPRELRLHRSPLEAADRQEQPR